MVYYWDNVITILTTMWAGGPRNCSLISGWRERFSPSSVSRLTRRPTQHTIQLVPSSIPGDKATGHETNHSHSPCEEVKNERSYNSTSPYAYMMSTKATLPLQVHTSKMLNARNDNAVRFSNLKKRHEICNSYTSK